MSENKNTLGGGNSYLDYTGLEPLTESIATEERNHLANNLTTETQGFALDARMGKRLHELIQSVYDVINPPEKLYEESEEEVLSIPISDSRNTYVTLYKSSNGAISITSNNKTLTAAQKGVLENLPDDTEDTTYSYYVTFTGTVTASLNGSSAKNKNVCLYAYSGSVYGAYQENKVISSSFVKALSTVAVRADTGTYNVSVSSGSSVNISTSITVNGTFHIHQVKKTLVGYSDNSIDHLS